MTELKTLKCPKCKYCWVTKSKKANVSCPDCLRKVNAEKNEIKNDR